MDIYRFFWGEFCDWGIELSKADKESVSELGAIFKDSLKLIHPFMPFISEYLYHELSNSSLDNGKSIMIEPFPEDTNQDREIEKMFELVIESIVSLRRAKANIDLPQNTIDSAQIKLNEDIDLSMATKYIEKLAKVKEIKFVKSKVENAVTDISDNLESYISLDGIDLTPIIKRLENQKNKLEKEVGKLNGMLSNKNFIANAPKEVVEQNQAQLDSSREKLEKVKTELKSLEG
jgi:valyl-tRNA synthetase